MSFLSACADESDGRIDDDEVNDKRVSGPQQPNKNSKIVIIYLRHFGLSMPHGG